MRRGRGGGGGRAETGSNLAVRESLATRACPAGSQSLSSPPGPSAGRLGERRASRRGVAPRFAWRTRQPVSANRRHALELIGIRWGRQSGRPHCRLHSGPVAWGAFAHAWPLTSRASAQRCALLCAPGCALLARARWADAQSPRPGEARVRECVRWAPAATLPGMAVVAAAAAGGDSEPRPAQPGRPRPCGRAEERRSNGCRHRPARHESVSPFCDSVGPSVPGRESWAERPSGEPGTWAAWAMPGSRWQAPLPVA